MYLQVQHVIDQGCQGGINPHHPHPWGRIRPIRFPSWKCSRDYGAQWRDFWGRIPTGPTSGITLRTSTCDVILWYWRKATSPTPAALSVACLFPTKNLIAGIPPLLSVDSGRSGNGYAWQQRRKRLCIWWYSLLTSTLSWRYPLSSTWGGFCRSKMTTGWRWLGTCRERGRNGCICCGYLLGKGLDAGMSGIFYTAVVQADVVYGSDLWFVSSRIGKALGGFRHQVIRWLTRHIPHWRGDGKWTYLHLVKVVVEAVLQEIETYATYRQNTVTQYIVTRPIMNISFE